MSFLNKGKRVKMLLSNKVEKGEHWVTWNKTDNTNQKVAKGIYFEKRTGTKKLK